MVSQLNFIFTHEVLLLLQISILVSSWEPACLSLPSASQQRKHSYTLSLPRQTCFRKVMHMHAGYGTASDLAGECCFLGFGIAHPFLIPWRTINAIIAVLITAKDLRKPI